MVGNILIALGAAAALVVLVFAAVLVIDWLIQWSR